MSADYSIRPATRADINEMIEVEAQAGELFRTVGYDYCADGPNRDIEEHERIIANGVTFVIETGAGKLVGFAMFEPMDGAVHLTEIDVIPDYQRQGLARRLIDTGTGWARDRGVKEMTLTTYRDVSWNAPYYTKLGFEIFEPEPARSGLLKTIKQEADWGFAFAPRVAMRKPL